MPLSKVIAIQEIIATYRQSVRVQRNVLYPYKPICQVIFQIGIIYAIAPKTMLADWEVEQQAFLVVGK
ncbi:MAG: hypothetical protein HC907_36005 [Richelia sp. SM1_7_0]|nr:hypothetical protein [Richelia sp. SM1_7_0]